MRCIFSPVSVYIGVYRYIGVYPYVFPSYTIGCVLVKSVELYPRNKLKRLKWNIDPRGGNHEGAIFNVRRRWLNISSKSILHAVDIQIKWVSWWIINTYYSRRGFLLNMHTYILKELYAVCSRRRLTFFFCEIWKFHRINDCVFSCN